MQIYYLLSVIIMVNFKHKTAGALQKKYVALTSLYMQITLIFSIKPAVNAATFAGCVHDCQPYGSTCTTSLFHTDRLNYSPFIVLSRIDNRQQAVVGVMYHRLPTHDSISSCRRRPGRYFAYSFVGAMSWSVSFLVGPYSRNLVLWYVSRSVVVTYAPLPIVILFNEGIPTPAVRPDLLTGASWNSGSYLEVLRLYQCHSP
jgi:hypothetical protein